MYPNFENKQDCASKHSALLARIARDQRLEEMKRDAYANALWATDSEDTKQKDATENADLIKRIMTAMDSKVSSKATDSESDESGSKPAAPPFSSVADIYDEMSKPTEAQTMSKAQTKAESGDSTRVMSSEDMDAPMRQEAALEEAEVVKKDLPPQKNQQTYEDGIVFTIKKHPELSNISFKPVIIRDGEILEHEYKLRYPDGEIINNKGNKMRADNRMMREVDWELTEKAVRD